MGHGCQCFLYNDGSIGFVAEWRKREKVCIILVPDDWGWGVTTHLSGVFLQGITPIFRVPTYLYEDNDVHRHTHKCKGRIRTNGRTLKVSLAAQSQALHDCLHAFYFSRLMYEATLSRNVDDDIVIEGGRPQQACVHTTCMHAACRPAGDVYRNKGFRPSYCHLIAPPGHERTRELGRVAGRLAVVSRRKG